MCQMGKGQPKKKPGPKPCIRKGVDLPPDASWTPRVRYRRELVATYHAKHMTQREISNALTAVGCINPDTDKPWTHTQIQFDLQAIEYLWRWHMIRETDGHRASHLAELRELRRQAWRLGDLDKVLRSLKQESELLGLDEPLRINYTEEIRRLAGEDDLDPEEAIKEFELVLAERGWQL